MYVTDALSVTICTEPSYVLQQGDTDRGRQSLTSWLIMWLGRWDNSYEMTAIRSENPDSRTSPGVEMHAEEGEIAAAAKTQESSGTSGH